MASELLLEILDPDHDAGSELSPVYSAFEGSARLNYLARLADQSAGSLRTSEPQALANSLQSVLLSLQDTAKRSHRLIIDSTVRHSTLSLALATFGRAATDLQTAIPTLDAEALYFSATYSKAGESHHLLERQRSLLVLRNVERLVNVLELPTLLASATTSVPPNYSSALDLNGHVRRLHALYPNSPVIGLVSRQADEAILQLTSDLIATLKYPGLKLATAVRTVSWLRRVLSDLNQVSKASCGAEERALSLLFLRCRVATLDATLGALEPLRKLAEQEMTSKRTVRNTQVWSGGQQTERYLKRYIEIFREQSFLIISTFKSLFLAVGHSDRAQSDDALEPLHLPRSFLSSFTLRLVNMLLETLRIFLPVIKDPAARDSILTQVLYCSNSLGRLGGEFGTLMAEWVGLIKRHRLIARRLDSIIGEYRGVTKSK
ncbi:Dor1-like family protein [Sodiomyces alkalinus F11]|uniref:Conserved oligomeric Golgi complex subunit 8 n=1 Tax=Sodiomyces alkalinus (strain CBS 110278 / VKM F-3762 / F11) TaxID=1314773 RepID=A0A3N2PJD5_SODAK|nr:Dor1-like family protein [Sodiomyces alkalinus F11]ROT34619.1 Dor1-like family protein [Sodiomyces alkalinus F11]